MQLLAVKQQKHGPLVLNTTLITLYLAAMEC